jgi:hypothetical protein
MSSNTTNDQERTHQVPSNQWSSDGCQNSAASVTGVFSWISEPVAARQLNGSGFLLGGVTARNVALGQFRFIRPMFDFERESRVLMATSAPRPIEPLNSPASGDSFLHAQRAESQGSPHRIEVGICSRSARSTDSEEVVKSLSPRQNGSVWRSMFGRL